MTVFANAKNQNAAFEWTEKDTEFPYLLRQYVKLEDDLQLRITAEVLQGG
jgi:hypothetical protein